MCQGTSILDSCCECTCPVTTNSTCYKITHEPIYNPQNNPAPAVYSYGYTNPSTGLAQTAYLYTGQYGDDPTVIHICSSTYPTLTNAATLTVQPNGTSWPFPVIEIKECFTGTSCTSCP